jgi:hypothetical protein
MENLVGICRLTLKMCSYRFSKFSTTNDPVKSFEKKPYIRGSNRTGTRENFGRYNEMKLPKKQILIAFSMIFVMTIPILLTSAPLAKASNISTNAYLAADPNPVQVGTQAVIDFWVQPIPPTPTDIFHAMTVYITLPDGTSQTMGPYDTSPLGSQFFLYTPAKIGTYQFYMKYPGETFANNVVYASATSPVTSLTVQQQPLPQFQEAPVPGDYWTRPIDAQNRGWAGIAGNWFMRAYNATYSAFGEVAAANPYSQGVRAPHVMWTLPLTAGGLIGGQYGAESYYTGQSYEPKLTPPIIMNGILYYNIYPSSLFGSTNTGFAAVDLRTGQQLYVNPNYTVTCGQVFLVNSGNQGGGEAYLWSEVGGGFFGPPIASYLLFDAFTGQLICSFPNGMPGTIFYGSDGTMFIDILDGQAGWHALWNSTKCFQNNGLILETTTGGQLGMFEPRSGSFDWTQGIQWNVTVPIRSLTLPEGGTYYPSTGFITTITGNVIVQGGGSVADTRLHAGYSLIDGHELWYADRTSNAASFNVFTAGGDGIYAQFDVTNMDWAAYNAVTGAYLWTSDKAEYPYGSYMGNSRGGTILDGLLFYGTLGGYEHAINITSGKEVWKFASAITTETAYNRYPMGMGPIVAGGIVYCGVGEHSPTHPLYRGGRIYALDEFTGKELWEMDGYFTGAAIADGYLVTQNQYDNQIYCFGKGPSATTVSASPKIVGVGSSVLIEGDVTDQSTGQTGTPAISDTSMGGWMAYLKEQQTMPATVTGVPVTIFAIGPDGKESQIGQTTSDVSGHFAFMWTPPGTGVYKIAVSFGPTDSYGSSYAETAVGVTSASPAPHGSPTTSPSASPSTSPTGQTGSVPWVIIVVAVAVIVIIIAAAVILTRRKTT